ncbi:MAG TPA: RNA polymerase factor sigma-32 [Anaeromyxobacteraceae bacterium]|nr:RNA polymerase factor sigma-32 [Anaeromyxobacteraceae bacterium]
MKGRPRIGTAASSSLLRAYLAEISRVPLLSPSQELRLAGAYRDRRDLRAAHALVSSNLRFVVRIALRYQYRGLNLGDLIQEGNLGLLRSVELFDPRREVRLITYAAWWVRAHIQAYVLRSWSLVRIGTTERQRRLFCAVRRTHREIERQGFGFDATGAGSSTASGMPLIDAEDSQARLASRDLSLDFPSDEDAAPWVESVASDVLAQDDALSMAQEQAITARRVQKAMKHLSPRERYIVERRIMQDDPTTLQAIGDQFGLSRERTRQLEARAVEKLRAALGDAVRG